MAPGWYGKIPTLGDFAARGLPGSFVGRWDRWLQGSIRASREHLGDDWLTVYLSSPAWRFALMPGCLDGAAWVGVLVPSVDRVGRYFPLTIAAPLEDAASAIDAMIGAREWFQAIEHAALDMLDPTADAAMLDARLAAIGTLPVPRRSLTTEEAVLRRFWEGRDSSGAVVAFDDEWALADAVACSIGERLSRVADGRSLWWLVPEEVPGPVRLRCFTGLPPEGFHASLLAER